MLQEVVLWHSLRHIRELGRISMLDHIFEITLLTMFAFSVNLRPYILKDIAEAEGLWITSTRLTVDLILLLQGDQ